MWKRRRRQQATVPEVKRPTGTFVPTPTLERHRVYRLDSDIESYEVFRDGEPVVGSFGGTLAQVVENYREIEAEDEAALAGLRSGVAFEMCRLGWHRIQGAWLRLANGGRKGKLLVYWMGREPIRSSCRAVMRFDGKPATCIVCNHEVDADTPPPEAPKKPTPGVKRSLHGYAPLQRQERSRRWPAT